MEVSSYIIGSTSFLRIFLRTLCLQLFQPLPGAAVSCSSSLVFFPTSMPTGSTRLRATKITELRSLVFRWYSVRGCWISESGSLNVAPGALQVEMVSLPSGATEGNLTWGSASPCDGPALVSRQPGRCRGMMSGDALQCEAKGKMLQAAAGKWSRGILNPGARVIQQLLRAERHISGNGWGKKKKKWKLSSTQMTEYTVPSP